MFRPAKYTIPNSWRLSEHQTFLLSQCCTKTTLLIYQLKLFMSQVLVSEADVTTHEYARKNYEVRYFMQKTETLSLRKHFQANYTTLITSIQIFIIR